MRSATLRLPGHPDHACALIAEAIVDEYTRRDPASRLRIHVSGGRGVVFVCGDILSQADFDVSALVKQTLGAMGILDPLEPFVSLEPISSERVFAVRAGCESPVVVTGYATRESIEGLPTTVSVARRIAKLLDDKRQHDADWFWLGPDAEVTVTAPQSEPHIVSMSFEHGTQSLEQVLPIVTAAVHSLFPELIVETSPVSCFPRRGLLERSGSSTCLTSVYGSLLPSVLPGVGRDFFAAEKSGPWLARAVARQTLEVSNAKAILFQATYFPGEDIPRLISARDERGHEVSQMISREALSIEHVMRDWWRSGLAADALRWGFAGEAGMPWE